MKDSEQVQVCLMYNLWGGGIQFDNNIQERKFYQKTTTVFLLSKKEFFWQRACFHIRLPLIMLSLYNLHFLLFFSIL